MARLSAIRDFIARDRPEAAQRIATRIVALVELLREQPNLGHAGSEPDTRELNVGGTPFIIIYRVRGERIFIATIRHGRQHM